MAIQANISEYLINLEMQIIIERSEFRNQTLKDCKTQAEKDRWLDRWSQEDSARKISDAIRSAGRRSGSGFLGIF